MIVLKMDPGLAELKDLSKYNILIKQKTYKKKHQNKL